ncbi:MAG: VTT domain-containing protein [Rhodospirillales bacterium]|nr:VTT domain-containing protein [Rhodospirillales bacterium]
MSAKVLFRSSILFVSLVVFGLLLKNTELGNLFNEAWIDRVVRGQGVTGLLIFVAVGWGLTSVGLPRQLVAFLGGYAFGFVNGMGLSLAATVMGCITAFLFARLLARDLVAHKISGRIQKIDAFLSDNPFTMTLLIRFLPLGSNFLTNLAAGVSGVRAFPFFSGSALGYIPQMAVFALVGSGITIEPGLRISLSAVLFVASGVIGVTLYRKYRHGKTFDDTLERGPE